MSQTYQRLQQVINQPSVYLADKTENFYFNELGRIDIVQERFHKIALSVILDDYQGMTNVIRSKKRMGYVDRDCLSAYSFIV